MTVYFAAASLADVNPKTETGAVGTQTGTVRSGDIMPAALADRNGLLFTVDTPISTNAYHDFLAGESPVPIDATPKWVHFWWDLQIDTIQLTAAPSSDAFALYCSNGIRLLNFSNLGSGIHLRVYDAAGTIVHDALTPDYIGRNQYNANQINIKITGGSPGNVTVYEGNNLLVNVDVPNINSDFARIRIGQPDDYGDENYFQEFLIADWDTRNARVKSITLTAPSVNTANTATVEANMRSYLGNHTTYTGRTGGVFDADGQQIIFPSDGNYVKDSSTAIAEVRMVTLSGVSTGSPVSQLIPIVDVSGTAYPQTAFSPVLDALDVSLAVSLVTSPATSAAWTEAEINALSIGLEAEV